RMGRPIVLGHDIVHMPYVCPLAACGARMRARRNDPGMEVAPPRRRTYGEFQIGTGVDGPMTACRYIEGPWRAFKRIHPLAHFAKIFAVHGKAPLATDED